ncbi:MAG: hypothetical protein JRC86_11875 [Deltaproteobacteria bacterium]|nr:hypothetical protein [Deltaproteobacteria bacterium]
MIDEQGLIDRIKGKLHNEVDAIETLSDLKAFSERCRPTAFKAMLQERFQAERIDRERIRQIEAQKIADLEEAEENLDATLKEDARVS